MEILLSFFASTQVQIGAISVVGLIIGYVAKRIQNEKIKGFVGKIFYRAGVFVTFGLSKYKYTSKIWNSTVEPYLIDLIDNVIGEAVKQFILGLRSDNDDNKT